MLCDTEYCGKAFNQNQKMKSKNKKPERLLASLSGLKSKQILLYVVKTKSEIDLVFYNLSGDSLSFGGNFKQIDSVAET